MIAVSILGKRTYDVAEYEYMGKRIKTDLFPVVLNELFHPDTMYIMMTEEAKKAQEEKGNLKRIGDFREIIIPVGKTEDEMWEIFNLLTENLQKEDDYIIDITHGFRSQPIISLSCMLFLNSLNNARLRHIVYGAYEAKVNEITPVFDLMPFLDLIEWSYSVKQFLKNGDMSGFENILVNIHKETYSKNMAYKSKQLSGIGSDFQKLTKAFSTLRLKEVFDISCGMQKRMAGLEEDMENKVSAKPLKLLLDKTFSKFDKFRINNKDIFTPEGIEAQKEMINWYVKNNQIQPAITLVREFLVTRYMMEFFNLTEFDDLIDHKKRNIAEKELGELRNKKEHNIYFEEEKVKYLGIWVQIVEPRNNINHSSMDNKYYITGSKPLIELVTEICGKVRTEF